MHDAVLMEPLRWIRLARYCEATGDTADAVTERRRSGKWVRGLHWLADPDGKIWINPGAVNRWVEQTTAVQSSCHAE